MMCDVQASGTIELYFYGELPAGERADIQTHLRHCADCRQALDDLTTIREVLDAQPAVDAPPAGDWSGFMARLDAGIARASADDVSVSPAPVLTASRWRRAAPYLAAAAMLAIVTMSILLVVRRPEPASSSPTVGRLEEPGPSVVARVASPDSALASLSGQHFARSKVVVLGIATNDTGRIDDESWANQRERAASLLGDTRLYRRAAEAQGMNTLAGVMRDLEMVLLQTSMSEEPDEEALAQIQRLIRRRDLLTKMNASYETGP